MFSVIFAGACSRPRSVAVFWKTGRKILVHFHLNVSYVTLSLVFCIIIYWHAFLFHGRFVGFPTVKGPKRLFFLPPTAWGHGTGWTRSLGGFVSPLFYTFHAGRWSQFWACFFFRGEMFVSPNSFEDATISILRVGMSFCNGGFWLGIR